MTGTTAHYITTFKPAYYPSEKELHSTFGGVIMESDFNTEYNGRQAKESAMASRIVTARKFDYQCLRHAKLREEGKK